MALKGFLIEGDRSRVKRAGVGRLIEDKCLFETELRPEQNAHTNKQNRSYAHYMH